ncbi:MAG: glycosyltransferase [Anaerolineales bacterium]|nr:glycosyltransferase [Anaerolineales bacterium]MDW8162053.1 glycosyltransferase family 2 protein [Anaerolineales bacterium]
MSDWLILSYFPLVIIAIVAILNAFTFPRLHSKRPPETAPFVSVLIPMRNEAQRVGETVRSLLAQDYPCFEVILLDDQSEDGSAEIARSVACGDQRIRVIGGQPLPEGWLGKNWACHQAAQHAQGAYLLFSDADVRWHPQALSALISEALRTKADLLTCWPTQETLSWGERLTVPLMAFTILAYLPVLAVHHLPFRVFAAAMGQCLLFRREAYEQIGGHVAVRGRVVEDMAFAYAIKGAKLRLRACDANGLLRTRMYSNWREARNGFAKNILAGHANSIWFLLFSTGFHWWMFVIPWIIALTRSSWEYALFGSVGVLTRMLTAVISRQRARDALLLPVSVVLMTIIAVQSIWQHWRGRSVWKGRAIASQPRHSGQAERSHRG